MAKLHEEIIVIKVSTVVPEGCENSDMFNIEIINEFEKIVAELVNDPRALIEIEAAKV